MAQEYVAKQTVTPWWKKRIAFLEAQLAEARQEIERLTASLAGISGIAMGCGLEEARECVEKNQWASTSAMADVLGLRDKLDLLRFQLAEAQGTIARLSRPSICEHSVKELHPNAHCAPLAHAIFPSFYVIRQDCAEWSPELGTGRAPEEAWANAMIKLQVTRLAPPQDAPQEKP